MSQDKNDDSFRDLDFWVKCIVVAGITLIIVFALAVVFGGFFFGFAGLFALIGVHYESIGALLRFVLCWFLLGIVFEILEKVVLFFIIKSNLHRWQRVLWIGIVKFDLTWVVIHTVDELMTSITLSLFAEFLTAFLLFCADIVFDDKSHSKSEKS